MKKQEQEQACIEAKMLIQLLKNKILILEDFNDSDNWLSDLDKLKELIKEYYWDL